MRAIEVYEHMKNRNVGVDWSGSCDTFKIGNPDDLVRGIAVCWQSTMPNLMKAHSLGCNLFITHEPTFYTHMDDDPSEFQHHYAQAKRQFLQDTQMVIYRCHDVWDVMPGVGILDSWAAGLGFTQGPSASSRFYAAYPFSGSVSDLALHIKSKVGTIGQSIVQIVGNPGQKINLVALGTGAICDFTSMVNLGADAAVVTDDGINFWGTGERAADMGFPLIVVNHATSEEWGMRNLAAYLRTMFPDLPVHHIPQGCLYQVI